MDASVAVSSDREIVQLGRPSHAASCFVLQDKSCTENDATAPFYDPKFGLYHYFFAVHPGNRKVKRHVVSRNLAHWAYLPIPFWDGPEPFDEEAVFTGSTTVVDRTPRFVYPGLCDRKSKRWPSCDTGTNLCIAVPANASDPFYVNWTKAGVIMNNTQRDPSTAWQDPATGEWRLTTFGPAVYGSMDFKTWYGARLDAVRGKERGGRGPGRSDEPAL